MADPLNRHARDLKRHLLRPAQRLRLATAAARFSEMEDRVLLPAGVEQDGVMGTHPRCLL